MAVHESDVEDLPDFHDVSIFGFDTGPETVSIFDLRELVCIKHVLFSVESQGLFDLCFGKVSNNFPIDLAHDGLIILSLVIADFNLLLF